VLGEVLERISSRGNASFLAVLKRLGEAPAQSRFRFRIHAGAGPAGQ
jgi:hypothetical protein